MGMTILIFVLGLISGLFCRGINISIYHKDKTDNKPVEYNKAPVEHIPPELREYAEKTNGYINL